MSIYLTEVDSKDPYRFYIYAYGAGRGIYKIISPSGEEWTTNDGLLNFVDQHPELLLTYWQLFGVYRRSIDAKSLTKTKFNKWIVIRLDTERNRRY